jgi:hypothetical protein
LCLLRIRSEAFCAYNVPEELDFLFVKFAFLWRGSEVGLGESLKDFLDVLNVLLLVSFREDENVIHIGDDGNVEEVSEEVVNTSLLCC